MRFRGVVRFAPFLLLLLMLLQNDKALAQAQPDCLNGDLAYGACVCDPGWNGVLCNETTTAVSSNLSFNLSVPVLFPTHGWNVPFLRATVAAAFRDINANSSLLPHHTLKMAGSSLDPGCDKTMGAKAMLDVLAASSACTADGAGGGQYFSIIGPGCSVAVGAMLPIAGAESLTMVSPSSGQISYFDTITYPNFLRTVPSAVDRVRATVGLMRSFGMLGQPVALLSSDGSFCMTLMDSLSQKLKMNAGSGVMYEFYSGQGLAQVDKVAGYMTDVKDRGMNVILSCAPPNDVEVILQACQSLGDESICTTGHAIVHLYTLLEDYVATWSKKYGSMLAGWIWFSFTDRTLPTFKARYDAGGDMDGVKYGGYNAMAYDAAWATALAYHAVSERLGKDVFDTNTTAALLVVRSEVDSELRRVNFHGQAGLHVQGKAGTNDMVVGTDSMGFSNWQPDNQTVCLGATTTCMKPVLNGKLDPSDESKDVTVGMEPEVPIMWAGGTWDIPIFRSISTAVLFPSTGWENALRDTVVAAFEDINNSTRILPNHRMSIAFSQLDTGCSGPAAAAAAMEALTKSGSTAGAAELYSVIGPACSSSAEAMLPLLQLKAITLVSPASVAIRFEDSVKYPTYLRTVPSQTDRVRGTIAFMRRFGMTESRVGLLHANDVLSESAMSFLDSTLLEVDGKSVVTYPFRSGGTDEVTVQQHMSHLVSTATRVIVFSGYGDDIKLVLRLCDADSSLSICGRGFTIISIYGATPVETADFGQYKSFAGWLWTLPEDKATNAFKARFEPGRDMTGIVYNVFNSFAYDAAWATAIAYHKVFEDLGDNAFTGGNATQVIAVRRAVNTALRSVDFEGVSGLRIRGQHDSNDMVLSSVQFVNWQTPRNVSVIVADVDLKANSADDLVVERANVSIMWPGGVSTAPTFRSIPVAVLMPNDNQRLKARIAQAFDDVNSDDTLLPHDSLQMVFENLDPGCDRSKAIQASMNMLTTSSSNKQDIVAVIGPKCSSSATAMLPIMRAVNLTIVSPSATSVEFNSETAFPSFLRTVPSQSAIITTMIMVLDRLKLFGHDTALLHTEDDFSVSSSLQAEALLEARSVKTSRHSFGTSPALALLKIGQAQIKLIILSSSNDGLTQIADACTTSSLCSKGHAWFSLRDGVAANLALSSPQSPGLDGFFFFHYSFNGMSGAALEEQLAYETVKAVASAVEDQLASRGKAAFFSEPMATRGAISSSLRSKVQFNSMIGLKIKHVAGTNDLVELDVSVLNWQHKDGCTDLADSKCAVAVMSYDVGRKSLIAPPHAPPIVWPGGARSAPVYRGCRPGSFMYSEACSFCSKGQWQDEFNQSFCVFCARNRETEAAGSISRQDCSCVRGTYHPNGSSSAQTECLECPSHGNCEGGDSVPACEPAYFRVLGQGAFQMLQCEASSNGSSKCLGGANCSCASGYDGLLCQACDVGYERSYADCVLCTADAQFQAIAVMLASLLVSAVLMWLSVTTFDEPRKSASFNMLFDHIQMLTIFGNIHDLGHLQIAQPIFTVAPSASGDVGSVAQLQPINCVFEFRLAHSLFSSIFAQVFSGLVLLSVRKGYFVWRNEPSHGLKRTSVHIALTCCQVLFAPIATKAFGYMQTVRIGDELRLKTNISVGVPSQEYDEMYPYAVAGLVFALMIPIGLTAMFAWLIKFRGIRWMFQIEHGFRFFGLLYGHSKRSVMGVCWFLFRYVRQAAAVAIVTTSSLAASSRAAVLIILLLCCMLVLVTVGPYDRFLRNHDGTPGPSRKFSGPRYKNTELFQLSVQTVTVACLLATSRDGFADTHDANVSFSLFMILGNIAVVIIAVLNEWQDGIEKRNIDRRLAAARHAFRFVLFAMSPLAEKRTRVDTTISTVFQRRFTGEDIEMSRLDNMPEAPVNPDPRAHRQSALAFEVDLEDLVAQASEEVEVQRSYSTHGSYGSGRHSNSASMHDLDLR